MGETYYIPHMFNANSNLAGSKRKIKRPKKGWHRADIKSGLEKRGLSLRRLSINAGYHERSAQVALDRPWVKVEKLIASSLDVDPWEIWPERYDDFGRPVQPGNPNKLRIQRHHKKARNC